MSLRSGTVNIIKILSKHQTTSTNKHMYRTCNINDHTNSQRIWHLIIWISFRATSLPLICWLFLYRNARLVAPSLDYWGEIVVRDARYFCMGNLAARSIFTCITMIALEPISERNGGLESLQLENGQPEFDPLCKKVIHLTKFLKNKLCFF